MEQRPVDGYDNTMFDSSFPSPESFSPDLTLDNVPCNVNSDVIDENESVQSDYSCEVKNNYNLCLPQSAVLSRRSSSSSSSSCESVPPTPAHFPPISPFNDKQKITLNVANLNTDEGCTGIHNGPQYNYNIVQKIQLPADEKCSTKTFKSLTSKAVKIQKKTCRQLTAARGSSDSNSSLPSVEIMGGSENVKPQQLWKLFCCVTALITVTCVIIMAIVTVIFQLTTSSQIQASTLSPPAYNSFPSSRPETTSNVFGSGKLEGVNMPGGPLMLDRATWLAQPPLSTCARDNLTHPVSSVVVCHTATDFCYNEPECVLKIRGMQQFHIESKHWCDIAYNFLIGGDGAVYEGRGWNEVGSHTKGHNLRTLGVAFIGTYIVTLPNAAQIKAFKALLEVGVKLGKISADYSMYAQCQLKETAAPGWALAVEIYNWPHFDKSLPIKCTRPDP